MIRYYEEIGLLEGPGSATARRHRTLRRSRRRAPSQLLGLKDLLGVRSRSSASSPGPKAPARPCARNGAWGGADPVPGEVLEEVIAHLDRQLDLVRAARGDAKLEVELAARRRRVRDRLRELEGDPSESAS